MSQIQTSIKVAQKKGLKVRRNLFQPGWTIEMPGNSFHYSPDDSDMIRFVRGY